MKKTNPNPQTNSMVRNFAIGFLLLFSSSTRAQTWTSKADFINGESDYTYAFTINDTIYVGNSQGLGFYKYDPSSDTWSAKGNVPAALNNRWAGVGFAINGKGYVMGGVDASSVCTNDLWQYDPSSDSWIQKADFPGGKRMSAGCFVIGNKAYIGGGLDTANVDGLSPTNPKNDFWQYDATTDAWTAKANLPYDSSYLEAPFAFSIGSKGYLSCGRHFSQSAGVYGYVYEDSTFQYDTLLNTWTAVANFAGAGRFAGVSFVLNNIAYCGTGISQTLAVECFDDFYAFDPVANSWASLPVTPFPSRGFGVATTLSTGKAYFGTGWQFPSSVLFYKDWWEFLPVPTEIANQHQNGAGIKCFPNPCNTELTIQIPTGDAVKYTYTICNLLGQRIQNGDLPANNNINTVTLPNGQYVLQLHSTSSDNHQLFEILK